LPKLSKKDGQCVVGLDAGADLARLDIVDATVIDGAIRTREIALNSFGMCV
jgi:hypothetical protein